MRKFIFPSIILLTLCGCDSMTVHPGGQVALNYQAPQPTTTVQMAHAVCIGTFNDARENNVGGKFITETLDSDATLISGKYTASQPIAKIIATNLTKTLSATGYRIRKNARYRLTGTLSSLTFDTHSGIFSAKMTSDIDVTINLVNNKTKQVVWSKTFDVQGSASTRGLKTKPWLMATLHNTLDKLIQDVAASPELQDALTQASSSTNVSHARRQPIPTLPLPRRQS